MKIKKCLFPVAGYGTRFLPATKAQPKEMLPILTKPLIQYGVEEAAEAGLKEIAFVTGRNKRAIEDHFDITYELEDQIRGTSREERLDSIRGLIKECTYTYTRQIEMRGLGDAILTGNAIINNEPFGVILADDLCVGEEGIMTQMLKVYDKYKCCVVAVEEVPLDEVNRYGIISGQALDERHTQVETMVEKPTPDQAPSNLAIIGRYILTPEIFDVLRTTKPGAGGEVQITDALQTLAHQGKVIAYRFQGRRFDCGSIDGFVEATNFFYERMKQGK
ncbi:UTP--glucose-1-phosphate uridylyltransferase GalU [Magnetovibrio blakemorei]|uniref:UTP--glucose-1-phosphate uridylyltransferase n=1 Tax=Magnetovibrio blakemorei TaxID=28181 RepID=A0A1E5Q5Q7_9PROT|nr:UTP--glucose-1-phosphate uridylyltransferase GalU [Magnetovibrio blakemorei]OEJ65631.1 UTP--glucose-1-phosphate uridylyltransferase [Magnetovibrio blakemorei]